MTTRFFYGWWLVLVAFMVQLTSAGTITYSFSVIATPIAAEFNIDYSKLVLATSIMFLTTGLVSPLIGPQLDKRSLRTFMAIGSLSLCGGFLLLAFTQAAWQVITVFALFMSFGTLLLGPLPSSTLLARWFEQRRGQALGIAAMGTSVGGLLFPPLLQWLVDTEGWRNAMLFTAAGVIVLALLPVLLLVKNHPADMQLCADGVAPDNTANDAPDLGQFSSSHALLKNHNFWYLALTMGAMFGVYTALLQNFIPLAATLDIARTQAAWLISVIAISGMLGKLVFGTLADRIDLRHGLASAIVLIISCLALLQLDAGVTPVVIACVVLGLSAGGMLPVWGALIARLFGAANYGRAMGMMSPILLVFMMSIPPTTSRVFDSSGHFTPALQACMIVLAAALFVLYRLPAQTPQKP